MTVLEVTYSQTESEITRLVKLMGVTIPEITDFTFDHRTKLVKPMLSFDAAAIALSFLPATGEETSGVSKSKKDDYTYHHLRRDIYALSKRTGVEVASRYVVPSSHLTIARFVTQEDFMKDEGNGLDTRKIASMIRRIEVINASLDDEGGWTVGEEKGLVCRTGSLWYGGGQSQHEGRGL